MSAAVSRFRERRVVLQSHPLGHEQLSEERTESEVTELLTRAHAQAVEALRNALSARDEWVRDQQEAETRRQSLLEQARDVETQRALIVERDESGTCPLCARQLDAHYRAVLEVLDTQADSITEDEKYFRARIAQLGDPPGELDALDTALREAFDTVFRGLFGDGPSSAVVWEAAQTTEEPPPPSDDDLPPEEWPDQ